MPNCPPALRHTCTHKPWHLNWWKLPPLAECGLSLHSISCQVWTSWARHSCSTRGAFNHSFPCYWQAYCIGCEVRLWGTWSKIEVGWGLPLLMFHHMFLDKHDILYQSFLKFKTNINNTEIIYLIVCLIVCVFFFFLIDIQCVYSQFMPAKLWKTWLEHFTVEEVHW